MLNSHFYYPCKFCEGEGGTHHVFFNCKGIEIILKELDIDTDLKNIVGSVLTKKETYMANIIIKLIILFNKQCYKSKKNDSDFRITTGFIKDKYLLFKYEKFSSY